MNAKIPLEMVSYSAHRKVQIYDLYDMHEEVDDTQNFPVIFCGELYENWSMSSGKHRLFLLN